MTPEEQFVFYKEKAVSLELERIAGCLKSVVVKTTTPSRAGFRVQTRLSWKDPDGKPGLGYFALDTSRVGNVTNSKPLRRDFVSSVFRCEKWATVRAAAAVPKPTGWSQFETALLDQCDANGLFDDKGIVDKLLGQSLKAIRAVVNTGKDQKIRRIRNKKKARDYLLNALLYGLGAGLRDDEVRDLVKQALVEHTMKS